MATPSKAQQFYIKALLIGGWDVRRLRADEKRTVIVSRGPEAFEFCWAPNAESGRIVFLCGFHRVDQEVEEYSNVREALRIMAQPAGKISAVRKDPKPTSETPEKPKDPARLTVRRLPFDADTDTDDAVIISLAGRRIEWQNGFGALMEMGTVPEQSNHTRITRKEDDEPGARILNFFSQDGSPHRGHVEGRYVAVRLDAIRSVK